MENTVIVKVKDNLKKKNRQVKNRLCLYWCGAHLQSNYGGVLFSVN
jgi:hypothetical protein